MEVLFTQAFTVDKIDVSKWPSGRKVAFVDLAVNNRDKSMTAAFVQRVREEGHELVAIIDEQSREDWLEVLGNFNGLVIDPQSQNAGENAPKSSGAVLLQALQAAGLSEAGDMRLEDDLFWLLRDADAADRMDFATHFGAIANQAVKSDMSNDARRVYLARHFAVYGEADETIRGWMAEYEEILANHRMILDATIDLGGGFVRVTTTGLKVDMTTLMAQLYKLARIVVAQGVAFVPAEKRAFELVSIGTADKSLDLLAIVRHTGINALGGFAQKANVSLGDEQAATAAIRAAIG